MRLNFKAVQTQILNRFLQEIVFIELKENQSIKLAEATLPSKILLPVVIEDLAETIRQDAYDQIPPLAILKGLVLVVGADPALENHNFYVTLLKSIDEKMYLSILHDGLRYAQERQYARAILYFSATLALDAQNIDAYYNMGRSFEDLSEQENRPELIALAKYCFEETVSIDPTFAAGYHRLGFILYNEALYKDAESTWLEALKHEMPFEMKEEIVVGLGRVRDKAAFVSGYEMILAGRVSEGLEVLKSLEEDHDEWWDLLFFIGVGYRMLEQFEDALAYFLKVMSLNTGHIQTMNEIGICLIAIGDYEEAERYYKEAMRLSPNNAELICNRGIVYYHRGDYDGAKDYFTKAYEISPEDEVVSLWLSEVNKLTLN